MVPLEQDHLAPVVQLQVNNFHQVLIDVISQTVLIFVGVKIVAKKDNPVDSIHILFDGLFPKDAPMHIRYYQYFLAINITLDYFKG